MFEDKEKREKTSIQTNLCCVSSGVRGEMCSGVESCCNCSCCVTTSLGMYACTCIPCVDM